MDLEVGMLRRHLAFIIFFILMIPFNCASAGERKIVFAMDATWPPAGMVAKNKEITGFEPDLIHAMGRAGGFKPVIVNVAWEGIFVGLAAGEYDVVCSSVSITEERKKSMDFSIPYLEVRQDIVTLVESGISSVEDLKGKVLASQIGTTGYFASRELNGVTAKTYDEIGLAFEDLKNGRVDAVVCDDPVASAFVLGLPEFSGRLKLAFRLDQKEVEKLGMAVKKGDYDTLRLINKSLKAVIAGGEYDKLKQKWFGSMKKQVR